MKTIIDPVHGHITLTPLQEKLLETSEIQRMAWVNQLGLTKVVFPGANNSRFEHSLGVSFLAGEIAEHLDFSEEEKNLVQAAGLLHDIGHAPFSHTLEPLFRMDHMKLTAEIVTGKQEMPFKNAGKIPGILEEFGVNPEDAAGLICKKFKGKKCIQQIVFGGIDADQMDFLCRDSHYTGATYGIIDIGRTVKTMAVIDDEIVFYEKGISSVESFLSARSHMYSSVYIHHTSSIADKMLLRAAEKVSMEIPDFYSYTDCQLLSRLSQLDSYSKEMVERIIYRNLFKRAFVVSSLKASVKTVDKVKSLVEMGEKKIEDRLCRKTGIKKGFVLADLPAETLKVSEPRLKQADIKILRKDGSTAGIHQLSGVARALTKKEGTYSLFSVFSRKSDVSKAGKAAAELLE